MPQTWLTPAERDANMIENQHILIPQLEDRLKACHSRMLDLELALTADKWARLDENQRLKPSSETRTGS